MKTTVNILAAAAAGCLAIALAGPAQAQENFYAGKTVNMIVGSSPGGGFDLWSRALATHLAKHIPGSPSIVVQNMNSPMPAYNHGYNVAPKDGTNIMIGSSAVILYQLLGGPNANYDATKIAWLGRTTFTNGNFVSWHTSGVKTIEDAKAKEVPFGSIGANDATYHYPSLANKLLGTKFKIISGYVANEINGALERGEISAHAVAPVDGIFKRNKDWIDEKKINFLAQIGETRDPRLPDIPTFKELVPTERGKQLVDLITLPSNFGYAYWVSPEVPAERLAILREAFRKTAQDPAFISDMERLGATVRYEGPEYLQRMIADVNAYPADVKAEAATIVLPK